MQNIRPGDTVRVIWSQSGELLHCLLGNISNITESSLEIEYNNPDSITGKTNLQTIRKADIKDIIKR